MEFVYQSGANQQRETTQQFKQEKCNINNYDINYNRRLEQLRGWVVRNKKNSKEYRNSIYKEQLLPLQLTLIPRKKPPGPPWGWAWLSFIECWKSPSRVLPGELTGALEPSIGEAVHGGRGGRVVSPEALRPKTAWAGRSPGENRLTLGAVAHPTCRSLAPGRPRILRNLLSECTGTSQEEAFPCLVSAASFPDKA